MSMLRCVRTMHCHTQGLCRPALLACTAWLALLLASPSWGQTIALTFDDGPDMSDTVHLDSAARNAAILRQLAHAHIRSILFVSRVDDDPRRHALIRQWGAQGHGIANHSATHPDLNETTLADYEHDFLVCDRAIRDLPGYTKRFRYPYLKEGDTVEKRDRFRAFLAAQGYQAGPVSIDASDWYYSARLRARLARDPGASTDDFKAAYLRHLYDRAQYYDGLSQAVLGRSVRHVLLLHHNLINALFLSDVIAMFRRNGWRIIDAQTAFKDPVYAMRPDTVPAGESILWALARAKGIRGLRYPGEDEAYERPILDRLPP